ncbi:MAG: PilT/PilU family type 4a pilus ATPase [Coriobacteriales bacterium]|jgi:twitching motility protein PilT|nr:PilT/PilU family type 4a pilus ATPase [Coriobacteriales bacterium]
MDIKSVFSKLVSLGVADIFIVAGSPICYRSDKELQSLGDSSLSALDCKSAISQIYQLAGRSQQHYLDSGDDDFSFAICGLSRFRVNAYRQRGSDAAVLRVVPFELPDPSKLGIPPEVMAAAHYEHGLVLVTGPAGSGKSTTLACIIDLINHSRSGHIVTLENPIEFLHCHDRCLVSQREVGIDSHDYSSALRAILRESPDVILIGEMRDPQTIAVALTAAETGHLVLSTLHTLGAAGSLDRLIDAFSADQQEQVRMQLSQALQMVISQQLLEADGGGVVPAFEVMRTTPAIANLIREGRVHQLGAAIAQGAQEGMLSMDASLAALYQSGCLSAKAVLQHALSAENAARLTGLDYSPQI